MALKLMLLVVLFSGIVRFITEYLTVSTDAIFLKIPGHAMTEERGTHTLV